MHGTDTNTDYLNCLTPVWMVIVKRRLKFMSFSGIIGTDAPVTPFVTSSPQMETPNSYIRTDNGTIGVDNACWIPVQRSVGV